MSTYREAGVDITAGNRAVELIKPLAETDYYELYDLVADPGEEIDLSRSRPELQRALTYRLELFRDIDQWHGSVD